MNIKYGHLIRTILLSLLLNVLSLSIMAVELTPLHVWMTPDNIGLRAENPSESKFKEFLTHLTSGYSEQTFQKGDFLEVVIKDYIRAVFYVETRAIYHIGAFEEQGKCKARAVQHTWVNVESVDMRDINAIPLPKAQYFTPPLNPKDWSALGEVST